jgi:hypothetical protein
MQVPAEYPSFKLVVVGDGGTGTRQTGLILFVTIFMSNEHFLQGESIFTWLYIQLVRRLWCQNG